MIIIFKVGIKKDDSGGRKEGFTPYTIILF